MPLVQKYDLIENDRVFDTVTRQRLERDYHVDAWLIDAEIDTMGHSYVDTSVIVQHHDRAA